MTVTLSINNGSPSCITCSYGRRTDSLCDVHGIAVTTGQICRSYRTPGQSHQQSRKAVPLIESLRPGQVYKIAIAKSHAAQPLIHTLSIMTSLQRTEPSPVPGSELVETFEIKVRNIDGSQSPARIDCYENGLFILVMSDIRYGNKLPTNAFHALQEIRLEMEVDGRMPLVNGANRDALVSGMAISMGSGYVVYLASQPLDNETFRTAQTFGTDFVTDPVYVAEQNAFKNGLFNTRTRHDTTSFKMPSDINAAFGACLGALAGDAAGATLEFLGRKPTSAEVAEAMSMIGGGVWKTAPGQITDDGELTLSLLHALSNSTVYDKNLAAHWYRRWYLSKPFDIGNATSNALGFGDLDSPTLAQTMMANAQKTNSASKANGSLMRLSALGAWSANVDLDQAINAAKMDAQLTHPNPSCQWVGAAYVVAIRHLVLNPRDAQGAFRVAEEVLSTKGAEEVLGWLKDAKTGDLPKFHPSAGFVRIGFTHAFHHLVQKHSYELSITRTLSGGGDTDTNACIVGGLIGALHGADSIPTTMRERLIGCDTQLGRPRPTWLHTSQLEQLISTIANVHEFNREI